MSIYKKFKDFINESSSSREEILDYLIHLEDDGDALSINFQKVEPMYDSYSGSAPKSTWFGGWWFIIMESLLKETNHPLHDWFNTHKMSSMKVDSKNVSDLLKVNDELTSIKISWNLRNSDIQSKFKIIEQCISRIEKSSNYRSINYNYRTYTLNSINGSTTTLVFYNVQDIENLKKSDIPIVENISSLNDENTIMDYMVHLEDDGDALQVECREFPKPVDDGRIYLSGLWYEIVSKLLKISKYTGLYSWITIKKFKKVSIDSDEMSKVLLISKNITLIDILWNEKTSQSYRKTLLTETFDRIESISYYRVLTTSNTNASSYITFYDLRLNMSESLIKESNESYDFIKSALEELNDDPLTREILVKKCWFDNGVFDREEYAMHPSNLKERLDGETFDGMLKTNPPTTDDVECCPGILEVGHEGYVIDVKAISMSNENEFDHTKTKGFKYYLDLYKKRSDLLQKVDDFIEISKKKYKYVKIYYSQGSIWIYIVE